MPRHDVVTMRGELKAIVETIASRRIGHILKEDPSAEATYILDDMLPRAAITIKRNGQPVWMEFVESVETAGKPVNGDDYLYCAQQFGGVTVHFPEASYPTRDFVQPVFNDILSRMKEGGAADAKLSAYLYDTVGTFKKVR
jgi:hypothetical protein